MSDDKRSQRTGPNGNGPKSVITYRSVAGSNIMWSSFSSAALVKGDHKSPLPYHWYLSYHDRWQLETQELRNGKPYGSRRDIYHYPYQAPLPSQTLRSQSYNGAYFKLQKELLEGHMGWGISAIQHKLLLRSIRNRARQAKSLAGLLQKNPSDERIIDFLIKERLIAKSGVAKAQVQGRTKHVGYFAAHGANSWLELSYGYLPILWDLMALRDKVADAQAAALTAKRKYRATRRSTIVENDSFGMEITTKAKSVAVIDVSVWTDEESRAYTLQKYGFLNVPVIAADAVPGSFIVNWFTNHERYLHALTAQTGRKLYGYIGYYDETVREVREKPNRQEKDYHYQIWYGRTSHTVRTYRRSPVRGQVPAPSLDGWAYNDTPFRSLMRQLNAAALTIAKIAPWLEKRDNAARDQRNKLYEARRNIGIEIEYGKRKRFIPGSLTMAEGQRYLNNIKRHITDVRVVSRRR